jgi:catechol 2,3-dioxygenase-like lactoylglutathione lyase family enzyme
VNPRLGWPSWIGVVADDLQRQRRFYRDVLGFAEVAHGEDWVQFDVGDSRLLEIVQRSSEPQYDQARYQIGYAVEDIEAARDELIARGVQPVSDLEGSDSAGGSGRWCYFKDAEGNVFELKERRAAANQ